MNSLLLSVSLSSFVNDSSEILTIIGCFLPVEGRPDPGRWPPCCFFSSIIIPNLQVSKQRTHYHLRSCRCASRRVRQGRGWTWRFQTLRLQARAQWWNSRSTPSTPEPVPQSLPGMRPLPLLRGFRTDLRNFQSSWFIAHALGTCFGNWLAVIINCFLMQR